jgi:hypothetical protein
MNTTLLELCNLIAGEGARIAHQHKVLFLNIVKNNTGKAISEAEAATIYKIFSFLNWAYANGAWSNLSNTTLRRDLMGQIMKSIVLRTAQDLAKDKSNEGIAFVASGLDQEFKEFVMAYNIRIKELASEGFEPDANTATLCGLEWIQDCIGLSDDHMNDIVPQFNNLAGDVAKIEDIAKQVNQAAPQVGKGFLSRIFGS